ncbi:MAG: MBL fold metallo-hydrolase [Actinomycetota bacterium]|nr:MBL fold metallo-hydrolase [Actinomycetota bacterium]
MLLLSFPAGVFGTNCYVLASARGAECVVIDPGMDAVEPLQVVLAEYRLKPVAVVLTHGHLDHTFSVVPLCSGYGIAAYIHPEDGPMMADPVEWHGPALAPIVAGMAIPEPDDLRFLAEGTDLELAGVVLTPRHAPGHTLGSTTFDVTLDEGPGLISGDLLFAGSIGRVDLPGGSMSQMTDSLARVVLPLDDATVVLPGHGPATTIGRERLTNPYLQDLVQEPAAPRRSL